MLVGVSEIERYSIVQLRNGTHSVHSAEHGETMHPGLGPAAEAEELYVRQIDLPARLRTVTGEFVIWDVGLGAAANASAVLRAGREISTRLRLVSFEHTTAPLRLALSEPGRMGYLAGYETAIATLLEAHRVEFENGSQPVRWDLCVTDFPALLHSDAVRTIPAPHVILFDPWSPAKNPAMWCAPVFNALFRRLDPLRPCVLPTYSRSTMLRVTLLLAGFYVGAGRSVGRKEETTLAANQPGLIEAPLGREWLSRAERSGSAEPLWEPAYRQAPITPETLARLRAHPQFH